MQLGEDLIISCVDIAFRPEEFDRLIVTEGEVVFAAGLGWCDLWKMRMDKNIVYDGKDYNNMYMTSLLYI